MLSTASQKLPQELQTIVRKIAIIEALFHRTSDGKFPQTSGTRGPIKTLAYGLDLRASVRLKAFLKHAAQAEIVSST